MILKVERAIRHPEMAYRIMIRKSKGALLWNYYFSSLREPKVKSSLENAPSKVQTEILVDAFRERNISVVDFKIDIDDFRRYLENAGYTRFLRYYNGGTAKNFCEKALEHYLAAKVLGLSVTDVYIDVASSYSPVAEIYHRLFGCKTYRQDMIFPKGLKDDLIGGDACDMPIQDGFATKIALHCSFEHFEQDSDIRFIREANRVLKEGGKLCILPLYVSDEYAILTDPASLPKKGINFDSDAKLYCIRNWGERHARYYDPSHLVSRIINNSSLMLTIYVVKNAKEVDNTCYVRFIALFEKKLNK